MLSFYVTGTDTGIGKTWVSIALLRALQAQGKRAMVMKPVASGSDLIQGGWRNADALALQAASHPSPDYTQVNPYPLPVPTAPEIAAAAAGVAIELASIRYAYTSLGTQAEAIVVEGVGGWATPLSRTLDQSTLVHALDLSVLLVVGLRLGCINHARLSAQAITADGARLLGWIGNRIDPELAYAEETIAILRQRLPVPCLGILPFQRDAAAPEATSLDLSFLSRIPACARNSGSQYRRQ